MSCFQFEETFSMSLKVLDLGVKKNMSKSVGNGGRKN